ncbi:hypothetical protein BGZ51_002642 [Haplosporangium sp. Z 767]|nr:hypothetical protein BGZ51_002642 [Haplosporangium sp. Z 767]
MRPHSLSTPTGFRNGGTSLSPDQISQTAIPTLSYTFSDDSTTDSDESLCGPDGEDDNGVTYAHDSETDDGSQGGQQGYDDSNEEYELEEVTGPSNLSRFVSSSSESLSAPVGHSNDRQQSRIQEDESTARKVKGKGRAKEDREDKNSAAELEARTLSWKPSKEKKRTKSMRDEGEPNRFKKLMGKHRERRHNQGRIEDPDVAWNQDGGFKTSQQHTGRRMTSGALTVVHPHHHPHYQGHNQQEQYPVLVSSPMSSEIDLPGTSHNRPTFVSSPMSSTVDIHTMEGLERPEPTPIQHMTSNSNRDGTGSGSGTDEQHLRPGAWTSPSSNSTSTLASLPMNSNLQRGSTWMTAREYASSIGHGSISRQTIQEESEPDDEEDDNADRFTLAKVFSQESEHEAADSGAGVHGVTKGQGSSRTGNGPHDRTVNELAVSDQPPPKEPLSTTISKVGTRFGRALLNRTPTGLKRPAEEEPATKSKLQPQPTICSINKECQISAESNNKHDGKVKKHVRFLTKVQIASSRQSTIPSTHPAIKQDRMLVRKEVTERPGPHVFNSDTARRMERQSQGWAEWWCVLKGPAVGAHRHGHGLRRRSKKKKNRVEKGRLEFYYNHKKIRNSVILSACTSVSIYSSLDYSIAVTQNFPGEVGLTVFILRPRTISLACAWYMEIYTLLNGAAPIPSFIEIMVPDFDVKIRVPIPEDPESEIEDDEDTMQDSSDESAEISESAESGSNNNMGTSLSSTLPFHEVSRTGHESNSMRMIETSTSANATPHESFQTAKTSLPERMASKSLFLTNDDARPMLVAPDEVTPKLLRSHVLSLLKDVPDWMEVVKMWQDPTQHGDVALCWKRYDRIEWIYWTERLLAETDNLHLKREHIGFADGSDWSGGMDETVVGPQILDKTHVLELRPITHYPTKARDMISGEELFEPDPIEGYLVRVSTFAGNPIRRFRRLYLTSHDHMLIYTNPSQSHSPAMQHAGSIDPSALLFCISPHQSTNPDHKDIAQSRSIRRLKAQVRAARGLIDMTKIKNVRVLNMEEWHLARHLSYKKEKKREREKEKENEKLSKRERLGKAVQRAVEEAEHRRTRDVNASNEQEQPKVILREPDNYFFPTVITEPLQENTQHTEDAQGSSSGPQKQGQQEQQEQQEQHQKQPTENENDIELDASEPMNNTLSRTDPTSNENNQQKKGAFKENLIKSATFVADLLLHNDDGAMNDQVEDSNVIEIEMKGGCCVRFRAYSAEAAYLWRDQLEKLAQYWTLRRHLDTKEHMAIAQANHQLASSLDDDEIQVGETINDWDNNRASCSPQIWNWCVVNGCRSVTKSGIMYMKPKLRSTFRKMFVVLTEGYLLFFHPHRRSKVSGQVIPSSTCKLYAIHSLTDIYIYSGHFADEDTAHGTNDETERLPRYYPDGLIVDDPDEDCTFSIWRVQRRRMFTRRSAAAMTTMSSRTLEGHSRIFGKDGLLSGIVKDGVVYGGKPQSCTVLRARSRPDLEEWVYAINMEVERCVRSERRRVRFRGHT